MAQDIGTYEEFLNALGQRESNNNYALRNGDFLGRFQVTEYIVGFGQTVPGLGIYNPDGNRFDNQYNGSWTGVRGINGIGDFLNSPGTQDDLIRAWFDNYVAVFASEDILHFVGQTIDGIPITLTGMIAGAHLIGYPALAAYLEGPKNDVPRDGFGTPVTEYLRTFGPYAYARDVDIDRSPGVSYLGSQGEDTFFGGGGNDTLNGQGGNDTARYAGAGADYLITRNGDGTFSVRDTGSGADEGTDTLIAMERVAFRDQTIELSSLQLASGGTFRPPVVEPTAGAAPAVVFDVVRRGTGESERLVGGDANDDLGGLGGNDTVGGRAGRDLVDGGEGDDVLGGGLADDTVVGGAGNDRQWGDAGNDIVRGDGGDDRGVGGAGDDTIEGGPGNDSLFGQAGDDRLNGGDGDDRLRGEAGNDTLLGGPGDDGMRGGEGDDVLVGGGGNDTVIGGAGADRFVFEEGGGRDWIRDFQPGVDRLDFSAYDGAEGSIRFAFIAEAAVLILGGADRVRLEGLRPSDLAENDFIF